jgi:choline dehydrogenase-like flavoprotein
METADLCTFAPGSLFEADLAIVGVGPAGLTLAREFFGTPVRVLVLESGLLEEALKHNVMAEVESVGQPLTDAQKQKRIVFHGGSSSMWSHDAQPYGVRSRLLGWIDERLGR